MFTEQILFHGADLHSIVMQSPQENEEYYVEKGIIISQMAAKLLGCYKEIKNQKAEAEKRIAELQAAIPVKNWDVTYDKVTTIRKTYNLPITGRTREEAEANLRAVYGDVTDSELVIKEIRECGKGGQFY